MKRRKILPVAMSVSMLFSGASTSFVQAKDLTSPVVLQTKVEASSTKSNDVQTNKKSVSKLTTSKQSKSQVSPLTAVNTIYLNTKTGLDSNNGASNSAVKTLDKALELAGEGGTIVVEEQGISINGDVTIGNNVTFRKGSSFSNTYSLFNVSPGGHLTVNNATIDGSKMADSDASILGTCINGLNSNITINEGAVFKNALVGIEAFAVSTDAKVTINGGEFYNLGDVNSKSGQSVISASNLSSNSVITVDINNVNIHDNHSYYGVIRLGDDGGNASNVICNMKNGTITNNTVSSKGDTAGILLSAGTLNLSGGSLTENKGSYGGAIYVGSKGVVNMTGGEISSNTASSYGGAISNGGGAVNISGGKIIKNKANYGGGIAAWGSTSNILISDNAFISENRAEGPTDDDYSGGGGVYTQGGKLTVSGGTISKNSASYSGGIDTWGASTTTTIEGNALITENEVTELDGTGGGIGVHDGILNLNGGTISKNKGFSGSGLGIWNNATAVMDGDTKIIDNINIATSDSSAGGAVFVSSKTNDGSKFIMKNGTISGNTAGVTHCGGIFVYGLYVDTVVQIMGGTISNNMNDNKDDQSIVVRGTLTDDGKQYEGILKLSGSPTITGQVYLRTETSDKVKVDVVDTFTPTQPIQLYVSRSDWSDYRTIVTYADGLEANLNDFVPYDANETQAIIKSGQNLQCMNKLRVIFKNDAGKTAKDMYVMPNTKISEDELPTLTKEGYTFKYWKEGESGKKWDFAKEEITEDVTVFIPEWQKVIQGYTVKYETNSNASIADLYVTEGNKATKPELSNPKKGRVVEGWYTTSDFKKGTKWNFDDPVKENMTLYAKWQLKEPTGTLKAEGKTTVHTGKTVKLIATANHEAADDVTYSYQWYKDGKALENKARAKEGTNEIEVDQTGSYTVKITASDGTYTSSAVETGPVEVEITDHTYTGEWKQDEKQHWKECDECLEKGEVGSHTYGPWKVIKEATKEEKGLEERTCDVCGHKQTREVAYNETDVPGNNTAPIIEAKDIEIAVGETFKAENYAKATDAKDGNLTGKIKIVKNNVDSTKAGTYEVTYQVTDSDGLSTSRTIKVTVKENVESPKQEESNQEDTKATEKATVSANKKEESKKAKTGDDINSMIYAELAGLSLLGGIILYFKKKKRCNE